MDAERRTPTVTLNNADTAGPTFTAPVDLLTNAVLTLSLTVNEGINTSSTDTVTITVRVGISEAVIKQLDEAILPNLAQVVIASTADSVARRIDLAFASAGQTASYRLDGQTVQIDGQAPLSSSLQETLLKKLPVHARSLADGTMDWKRLMSNSSFVLPLNAVDGDSALL